MIMLNLRKNEPLTISAGDVVVERRDKLELGTRYTLSIRPYNPALRRVVFLNVYSGQRKATCSAKLDMVEKAIVGNFARKVAHGYVTLMV